MWVRTSIVQEFFSIFNGLYIESLLYFVALFNKICFFFFAASGESSPQPEKIEENDADYEESTNNDDIDRLSVTSISVTVASLAALSDIADPLGEQGDLQSLAYPIGTPMKREAVDNTDSKSDVSSYCREPLRKKAAVEGK